MTRAQLSYCAEQVERFDNDRYLCSAFAAPARREGLLSLFAFNLEVARIREQVREPLLGQIRLQWWRETIEQIYRGATPSHPVAASLTQTVRSFDLTANHFERYLEGRERDLEAAAPDDLAALESYAEQTAASLSALALQVLGSGDEATATAMRHVAIAWALIGLLRAVPFHARARRVYLPTALNRSAGLDVFALFEKGSVPGLSQVVEAVATVAWEHLKAARAQRGRIARSALPALLVATLADHYLAQLRRCNYDPFDRLVGDRSKTILLRVAVNASLGRF